MKYFQGIVQDNISSMFLYLAILLANIDYKGLLDYCLKAMLGGLILFAYKIVGEHYILKIRKAHKDKLREKNNQPQHIKK